MVRAARFAAAAIRERPPADGILGEPFGRPDVRPVAPWPGPGLDPRPIIVSEHATVIFGGLPGSTCVTPVADAAPVPGFVRPGRGGFDVHDLRLDDAIDREQPHVLIVGGFSTSPPLYARMARRLRARGVASVSVAPVWLPDWMLAGRLGLGPLGRRVARTIAREWRTGGRRPLLVIGHSAGGVLARLAMSPVPFQGYGTGVGEAVGALITLGTPHIVAAPEAPGASPAVPGTEPRGASRRPWHGGAGGDAARFLERTMPGAALAPRTGYVTVSSRRVAGAPSGGMGGRWRDRLAGELYAGILGEAGRTAVGDGVIPVAAAHLAGAQQITLEDVAHGQFMGASWYGSDDAIDRWWPAALEAWRAALRSRAARG